jgi:hypothetical protein
MQNTRIRRQPLTLMPLTMKTMTNPWPGGRSGSVTTSGTSSGAYLKNDNYVGRMLTEIVTTGQGTKIMEYVRLLLKAQATRIFCDA